MRQGLVTVLDVRPEDEFALENFADSTRSLRMQANTLN